MNMNTNILIYSHDPVLRQAARDALAEDGFAVALAHNSYETLDQPDLAAVELIVLDVDYRGKAAWDLVEWLLENKPTTPIIFLTGGREDEWALVATVSVTLEKPAPAARLVEVVRNLLDEPTSQRLHRNSSQRLAVRSSRPYVWTAPVPAAYCGCGIND